jgi:hypothetical protein
MAVQGGTEPETVARLRVLSVSTLQEKRVGCVPDWLERNHATFAELSMLAM